MSNEVLAFDSFTLKKSVRTIDDNGFLHVAVSPVTREQVAPYRGCEIPHFKELGFDPETIYYGYRPAEELSKQDTIQSLNGIPIQFKHHPDYASAPAKDTRIGSTGTDAKWDAPFLTNSLHFQDKQAIDHVIDGSMKELSLGYRYEPVKKSGVFNGQNYDFIMTDISCNHLALVEEGRAGHEVCVGDEKLKKDEQVSDPTSKAVETMAQGIIDLQQNTEQDGDPVNSTEVQMDGKLEKLLDAMKAKGIDLSEYDDILNSTEDEELVDAPTEEQGEKSEGAEDDEVDTEEAKATEGVTTEDDDLDADEQKDGQAEDEGEEKSEAEDEDEEVKQETAEDEDLPADVVEALKKADLADAPDEVKAAFIKGFKLCAQDCEQKELAQDAALKKSYAELAERRCAQRYNAAEECACVLGRVKAMAYDCAGSIYRDALKQMHVKGYQKMKSNEARSVFRALHARGNNENMAQDTAIRGGSDAVMNILNKVRVGV